ncbi:OmpH family outer membrane protein [Halochromatium glycolicum]|uniref:OmpH family outer membrane protein n=1 Tax=Halochromatium glycolicum TaxID=85075 RepID=UPI001F5BA2CF|nr:OmpH family outer membrane protein [Halochromatium glycolicum]
MAYLSLLLAGTAAADDPFRIAVIDPNRIVEESPQYEAARNLLSAEAQEREAELAAQQEDIDRLENRLERDGALMRTDEITRLRNDIRARERRLRYAREELQADFALRQSDLRTKLVKQVEEVVEQVAKDNDIDLILSEGVVYSSARVDMSDEVIDRLKEVFEKR